MADIVKGKIGNALMSVAPDGIVATADAIYDETKGKSQEKINEDTKQSLAEQANNIGYYECGTAAATAAKEITGGSYKLPAAAPYGGTLKVKFTYKNSASNPTLSINRSPAKPLYYNGSIASSTNTWEDGDVLDLYYDGTNFNAKSFVEKFATGQKVKNVGIDTEPTAGSENLVKSGGVKNELALGAVYDVSAKNPTAGPNSDGKWESLSALLSDANLNTLIPASVRKGGMSIKFIQSSDNKYVQFRYMSSSTAVAYFTNIANWQGVDTNLKAGSKNLAESNAVIEYGMDIIGTSDDVLMQNDIQIYYPLSYLKNGYKIKITLLEDSLTPNVTFYTMTNRTVVQTLRTIKAINGSFTISLTSDAEDIYAYNNSGVGNVKFRVTKLGITEDIQTLKNKDIELDNSINDVAQSVTDSNASQNLKYNNIINGATVFPIRFILDDNICHRGGSYVIPIQENQEITIVGGNRTTAFTFIGKIEKLPAIGESFTFIGKKNLVNAGVTFTTTAPENAGYAIVTVRDNGGDCTPNSVSIDGVRVDTNLRDSLIENIKDAVAPLNTSIEGIEKIIKTEETVINSPTSGNLKQININNADIKKGVTVRLILIAKAQGNISISVGYAKTGGGYSILTTFYSVGEQKDFVISWNDYDKLFTYNNADSNPYTISYKILALKDNIEDIDKRLSVVEDSISDLIEIADNPLDETAVDNSEYFVKTRIIKNINYFDKKYNKNVVAINHDDFRLCDIVGVRRLYNKYGFSGNFNFMLMGFDSVTDKNRRVNAAKKLLREGHKIGLHNYFGSSYWWMNKLFDIRPDGTTTYAPTLSELQGPESDHTGVNIFGTNVTLDTKFKDCKFESLPNALNVNVTTATTDNWRAIIVNYCVLFNSDSRTALDLNDELKTKTHLEWAEYWYNELIDNTLGYSTAGDYAAKYAADYKTTADGISATGSYPDTEHLENGKVVFFDDVDNPHYNDADYQKVGYFDKGLFKGCATSRNCEVAGRIIDIATAFCRHYYDMVTFDNFGRHGERFSYNLWTDNNGFNYENREKTILAWETQKVFLTSNSKFISLFDILKSRGIKMTNHGHNGYVMSYSVYGQQKLFLGQSDIVGNFDNQSEIISYLDFFGPVGSSIAQMDYATFMSFAEPHKENWLKWAYENAGQTITNSNNDTMQMYPYIKRYIDCIKKDLGTGKIPCFSVDTIRQSPNIIAAVEILCQFCWANDISIVPMEVARKIANQNRDILGNMFPNPGFNQILLPMIGGSSSSADAYLPDGWSIYSGGDDFTFNVEYNQETGRREFSIVRTSDSAGGSIVTRIYGLSAGKYKFMCYYKTGNESTSAFMLYARKNNEIVGSNPSHYIISDSGHDSEWTLIEQEFTIEPPYRNLTDNSPVNKLCDGYANNVAYIELRLIAEASKTTSIALPSISKI